MCGIAGIFNRTEDVDKATLQCMTDRLSHRGPDGGDIFLDGTVGLGHRRLSIIDLEGGRQPMSSIDRTLWLTFNGEIYNFKDLRKTLEAKGHRFRTASDSEVIINAYREWGAECLHRLRGMFAFAIYDSREQSLFLARDRVGIKPLNYAVTDDGVAFASELRPLTMLDHIDLEVDLQALDLYLHFMYIPAPFTIYKGIRKLLPGHWMRVHADGRVEGPHRYWDLQFEPDHTLSESEWQERFDAALEDAIRSHLVSDVPFGAFLSGGIDSSSVVAGMSRLMDRPVETFTIGFEGWADGDEREPARVASEALGTNHREHVVESAGLDLLPLLVKHYGEPFGDSSAICTYAVAQQARRSVKMVLSGDGGDEALAGYSYFPRLYSMYETGNGALRSARRTIGKMLRRLGLRTPAPSLADAWYHRSPAFDDPYRRRLWHEEFHGLMDQSYRWNEEQFARARGNVLDRCQYVDMHNYLVYDNLCKVDIATMANALEVRVPLLDHQFLETVARIPTDLRLKRCPDANGSPVYKGKYLLRKSSEKFFPPGFHDRAKRGFSVPLKEWFAGPAYEHLRERLEDPAARMDRWFRIDYIRRLCTEHRDGAGDHSQRLYTLLFLAEWCAENKRQ